MSYVLAIDVGTSFTAAAVLRSGQGSPGLPEVLPLGLHGSAVPSVLYYADDGRILIGEAAERRGLDDPRRMVREFKRRIGDSVPLAVGDGWLAPEDVFAAMARWVVDRAQEREGGPASSIVMTHPASWGQHRTSVVLAALNLAGIRDVRLISEPEAAALHYASQTRVEDGSTIAVYDLGGGTFDTAILRKAAADRFDLLGQPDGIETLGGADFDAAVLRHVLAHLGDAATGLELEDSATLAALSRLKRECREAKEALSLDSETGISVALPGIQQSVRLVRSEFEAMIEAQVHDTLDAVERSLQAINVDSGDLTAVLLIGGSSRIPLVAELVSAELGRPVAVDADPKSSICLGAAISAGAVFAAKGATEGTVAHATAQAGPPSVPSTAVVRPDVVRGHAALSALKQAAAGTSMTGRHAPRSRLRMTAAAAAAATVLTVVTATAAQSPNGSGLLSLFASQAADVMRDGGTQAADGQSSGAPADSTAAAPVTGQPRRGLDASAGTGNSRQPAGTGQKGAAQKGAAGSGSGAVAGAPAAGGGAAAPGSGTPGAAVPGTQQPGTTAPGSPAAGTPTPAPTTPGGAASGPLPDPTTPPTQPPVTQPPTTPADPPPTTVPDPVTPAPEPTAPAPEPTTQAPPPPATQDPVPSDPVTEPAPPPAPETSTGPADPAPGA